MATAVLAQMSGALPPLAKVAFSGSFFNTGVFVATLAAVRPAFTQWSIPSPPSFLDIFPPFLLAVPKKKTSHSRKAMRSANKGLKDKHNIVGCPGCGSPKLCHHLCANCYSYINRSWKSKNKVDIPEVS